LFRASIFNPDNPDISNTFDLSTTIPKRELQNLERHFHQENQEKTYYP
jgi:hypothetical protein